MKTGLLLGLLVLPVLAQAGQNTLTWTDNSTNEATFNIERTTVTGGDCNTATGFVQITTVPSNTVVYVDRAVVEGKFYCYQVRAANSSGFSDYSNVAGRLVPLPAPSGLLVSP